MSFRSQKSSLLWQIWSNYVLCSVFLFITLFCQHGLIALNILEEKLLFHLLHANCILYVIWNPYIEITECLSVYVYRKILLTTEPSWFFKSVRPARERVYFFREVNFTLTYEIVSREKYPPPPSQKNMICFLKDWKWGLYFTLSLIAL